jgi:hypothetical protein
MHEQFSTIKAEEKLGESRSKNSFFVGHKCRLYKSKKDTNIFTRSSKGMRSSIGGDI